MLRRNSNDPLRPARVGYVVKRYPRYSETFIVNEILAHEAAGLNIEIFSLYPGSDTHFQDCLSRVRAPVTYLSADGLKPIELWDTMRSVCPALPNSWAALEATSNETARDVYQALTLAQAVMERQITHLHAHFATSSATVARLASLLTGVPFTFTAHAKDIFHISVQPADLRRKLSDAAATITVSDYNVQYLQEHYSVAAARVQRVYNGLDLQQVKFDPPTPTSPRAPVILAVGRLVEKKGFDTLIDACAILAQRGRDFRCLIIGTGEMEAPLRAQIAHLRLGQHVELLGPRPQRDVFELLRDAAVFTAPCLIGEDGNRDGLPTVLLEAMALGTPCVATDVTGIPEIVHDEQTGLLVPQKSPGALAAACARLFDDIALAQQLASAARRLIEANFDATHSSAQLRSIFAAASGPHAAVPDAIPMEAR